MFAIYLHEDMLVFNTVEELESYVIEYLSKFLGNQLTCSTIVGKKFCSTVVYNVGTPVKRLTFSKVIDKRSKRYITIVINGNDNTVPPEVAYGTRDQIHEKLSNIFDSNMFEEALDRSFSRLGCEFPFLNDYDWFVLTCSEEAALP